MGTSKQGSRSISAGTNHMETSMRKLRAVAAAFLLHTALFSPAYAQALNENPLSDVRVRQALAYAIDMPTIIETIFEGNAV